ncbi:MAG: tetratricopeptide repeat protein, partial [Cyclobacteriaceae bacterium]
MLKILISIYFLVAFFCLSAQNQHEADSLKAVLSSNSFDAEKELDLLKRIASNETDPVETKKFAEQLIEKAKLTKTTVQIYNGYYFLGQAERRLGNPLRSLDNFFECRRYADELSINAVCESNAAIADVYSLILDYTNAVRYYKEGIDAFEDTANLNPRDLSALALVCTNLGDTYFLMDSLDQALVYFAVSGRHYQRLDYQLGISYNNGNTGLVYAKMGQYDKAEAYISKAAESLRKLNDYYSVSIFYTYLADIFYEKGNFPKALEYAEESYSLAKEYNLKEQLRDAHLKLYQYHKLLADYDKALFHHENYLLFKDSISNVQSVSQIANLRTEFEV